MTSTPGQESGERKKRMFYVAMHKGSTTSARASCVDEPDVRWGRQLVREFYREYSGHEIRHVDGEEMKRLMMAGLPAPPSSTDSSKGDRQS